ncbi:glycosyltransferase [Methanolobus psychrotolerans]|uniref:glycosyltransferase n=1 Tax=Methanolobus psychrotolerans TaxID=1874706 RepID=UPI000B91AC2A|nr:glycosyltransferase [Methanolobus psychrotolerans]
MERTLETDYDLSSNVTVILPCFNEETYIKGIINSIHSFGLNNIILINDGSADNTTKKAKEADKNIVVIEISNNYGHTKTLLSGMYAVKTEYALIPEYSHNIERYDKRYLLNFIRFGIEGRHSLLLPEKDPFLRKKTIYDFFNPKISSFLRKKYGVILLEPRLDCVLVGPSLLEKIKMGTLGNEFIMLELIRIAARDNLKIGTYNLGPFVPFQYRHSLLDSFRENYQVYNYLRIAFPTTRVQNIKDQIIVAIVIFLLLRIIETIFSRLTFIFS